MQIHVNHTTRPEPQPAAARERTGRSSEPPARPAQADTVSLGTGRTAAPTYAPGALGGTGDTLRFETLRQLVVSLLGEQGVATRIAAGETPIDLAAITPAEACMKPRRDRLTAAPSARSARSSPAGNSRFIARPRVGRTSRPWPS